MNVVETRVNGLIVESKTQQNIVILREVDGERILPIWIGPSEAMAIRRILSEDPFPRPLTHDLLFLVVEGLKAKIVRVVISDLRENTFYASVFVQRESDMLALDARPSDSIALALRARAPIFVNDKLLQLKQLQNIGDQAHNNMQEAIVRGDEDARYHEFGRITIAYQQAQVLSSEADNCIGEDLTFLGQTSVTVEEPNIPEDPTIQQGPDFPVVEPLPVASPQM